MLAESQPDISKLAYQPDSAGKGQALDDAHLWQNLRKNNNLAFSILYKNYTPRLYNYGMHQFHDHDQVMDCLQELFTSIWSKRAELSPVQSVGAYLFKSFRRLMIKRINWRKKFLLSMDRQHERAFDVMIAIDRVIETRENEREQHKKLLRSLKGLTQRQREAIFLKFYNDLAYSDIAAIMEMQVDSVYNLISKAIDSLRRTLK